MHKQSSFIGIDVSKNSLNVHVLPEDISYSFPYEPQKIKTLIRKLKQHKPVLIVMEATGGYELAAATKINEAELPVAVVNPRQVRDYARAIGKLAKTDSIDAYVIARFARDVRPEAGRISHSRSISSKSSLCADNNLLRCAQPRRIV